MPLTTDTNWIIGFCCTGKLPFVSAHSGLSQDGSVFRRNNNPSNLCILHLCGCYVFVCHVVQKYRRKTWMTKTQQGLHASLCGVELMQRHYPFLFLLASPILYKGIKKKNSAKWGAIGEEHKAWQSHSHRPLIHNSINVENLFLRCPARAQREVCWWAQKKPLLPSVTEIWMSIRVCGTIWTFAFICS